MTDPNNNEDALPADRQGTQGNYQAPEPDKTWAPQEGEQAGLLGDATKQVEDKANQMMAGLTDQGKGIAEKFGISGDKVDEVAQQAQAKVQGALGGFGQQAESFASSLETKAQGLVGDLTAKGKDLATSAGLSAEHADKAASFAQQHGGGAVSGLTDKAKAALGLGAAGAAGAAVAAGAAGSAAQAEEGGTEGTPAEGAPAEGSPEPVAVEAAAGDVVPEVGVPFETTSGELTPDTLETTVPDGVGTTTAQEGIQTETLPGEPVAVDAPSTAGADEPTLVEHPQPDAPVEAEGQLGAEGQAGTPAPKSASGVGASAVVAPGVAAGAAVAGATAASAGVAREDGTPETGAETARVAEQPTDTAEVTEPVSPDGALQSTAPAPADAPEGANPVGTVPADAAGSGSGAFGQGNLNVPTDPAAAKALAADKAKQWINTLKASLIATVITIPSTMGINYLIDKAKENLPAEATAALEAAQDPAAAAGAAAGAASGTATDGKAGASKTGGASGGTSNVANVARNTLPSVAVVETDTSSGSAVVYRKDGYLVTNEHVVSGAQAIRIKLTDGRVLDAQLVGTARDFDLAVLKVNADNLVALNFDTDEPTVGETAIAIGAPQGLESTVTAGIVSAVGRSFVANTGVPMVDMIQTDAAVNPGNSGGALLDSEGNVIGINTAGFSPSDLGQGFDNGLNFAIPSPTVRRIADQLIEKGFYEFAQLGITGADVPAEIAQRLNLKTSRGSLVLRVVIDSSAHKLGLQPGDVITHYNDHEVLSMGDLNGRIRATSPGSKVKLTWRTQAGEEKTGEIDINGVKATS